MKKLREIIETINWNLPPKPGTASIPKDHVRLFHQTQQSHLGAIKHQGLQFSKSKGIEGPRGIYAQEGEKDKHGNIKGFYGAVHKTPTVEFHVHKDRWHPPFVTGDDVKPHEIVAVHHPWHSHAHYAEDNPEVKKAIVNGEHDNLLKDKEFGKAVRYIKHKYGE